MNTFLSFWSTNRLTPSVKDLSNRLNHVKVVHDLITGPYPRMRSFGMIRIRISDPRSLGNEPMNPLWTRIHRFIYDLGSLILIPIISKERTLNETTAFYEYSTKGQ